MRARTSCSALAMLNGTSLASQDHARLAHLQAVAAGSVERALHALGRLRRQDRAVKAVGFGRSEAQRCAIAIDVPVDAELTERAARRTGCAAVGAHDER